MTYKERIKLREDARNMFYHAYSNYMESAYPADELKPLSCTGRGSEGRGSLDDVLGGFSLTLIDALDTLVVLEDFEEFERASRLVIKHVTFNRNVVVSVFETTIRVLGGLLSAHLMSVENAHRLHKGYNGELLKMATELGDRMLPAFNTPTGIPYSRVNLMMGIPKGESPETCTAGAGTLLLEFGILSGLTGNPVYMDVARRGVIEIWKRRSPINLVGNVINVANGHWIRADSSIGAGIDSFFEYLLKSYILFGDVELYDIFVQAYNAIEKYSKKGGYYVSVHMSNGNVVREWIESLQMFWPGLQVSLGQLNHAADNFNTFYQLWRRFGLPPEAYSLGAQTAVAGVSGYPLRPEMIESAYMLFSATQDPVYLRTGKMMMQSIVNFTKVECGFAAVSDVLTKKVEDRFDSYFLSETCKYLYLLFDPDKPTQYKNVLFTTEGHIIPLNLTYQNPERAKLNGKYPSHHTLTCKNRQPSNDAPLFPSPVSPPKKTSKYSSPPPKPQPPKPAAKPTMPTFESLASQFSIEDDSDFMDDQPPRTVVEANLGGENTIFLAVSSNFGPEITSDFRGKLMYGEPALGCTPLTHPVIPDPSSGTPIIIMLDRGECMFGEKVRTAMNAGASMALIVDNIDQPNVFLMTDGLADPSLSSSSSSLSSSSPSLSSSSPSLSSSSPSLSSSSPPSPTPPFTPVTIPSILVNRTMGERIKKAFFASQEEDFMLTVRPADDDEVFGEESQFYSQAQQMAINIPIGQMSQESIAEAVMKQLQQLNVKIDGKFQLQYMDANNQPILITLGGGGGEKAPALPSFSSDTVIPASETQVEVQEEDREP